MNRGQEKLSAIIKELKLKEARKELAGFLRMDLYRAFVSLTFPLAVVGMAVLLYIGVSGQLDNQGTDVAYLHMVSQMSAFSNMFFILAALPFAASFCSDWNNQFMKPLMMRSRMALYGISKICVCGLSGFAVVALGQFLFVLFLRLGFPWVDPHGVTFDIVAEGFAYGTLLSEGHYVTYFVFHIMGLSLGAAFYTMLAFLISTRMTNAFVVLSSPMLLALFFGMIVDIFCEKLPAWAIPSIVLIGRCPLATPLLSFLYEVFVFGLVSLPLILLTVKLLKRKMIYG